MYGTATASALDVPRDSGALDNLNREIREYLVTATHSVSDLLTKLRGSQPTKLAGEIQDSERSLMSDAKYIRDAVASLVGQLSDAHKIVGEMK